MGKKLFNEELDRLRVLFRLDVDCESEIDDGDYENYIKSFNGEILLIEYDEDADEEIQTNIGYVEVYQIEGTRALDDGLDIFIVCDALDGELAEYAFLMYDDEGYIKEELVETPPTNDILIVREIAIKKEYQGNNLGILVAKNIIKRLGYSCGAVLINSTPLRFSKENDDLKEAFYSERFNVTRERALEKLNRYWRQVDPNIKESGNKVILYIPQE
ncbi:MAG: hypothetical protein LBQ52_02300 [Helicobacteraceae bacterium]|jgi:hypothetical protein|nr:hypothetical protein [Helicobacteraceae bacterium]